MTPASCGRRWRWRQNGRRWEHRPPCNRETYEAHVEMWFTVLQVRTVLQVKIKFRKESLLFKEKPPAFLTEQPRCLRTWSHKVSLFFVTPQNLINTFFSETDGERNLLFSWRGRGCPHLRRLLVNLARVAASAWPSIAATHCRL